MGYGLVWTLSAGVGIDRVSCGDANTTRVLTASERVREKEEDFGKKGSGI